MPVKLIAHVLLNVADSHLIIQRSQIKRGKPNVFPRYWDIPGGRVEENELPRDAAVRECFEETGILIEKENLTIIHEDSQFDEEKQTVFTRLVYEVKLLEQPKTILLDPEEHTDFLWLTYNNENKSNLVPYLEEILEKKRKNGF
ncbi:NUDIX hydrolase [Streptococcus suis]|uniref:NUDIX hydrolase n=1 Tax=Streptococcus suis TaxID=1307 RepID=UPI00022F959C|nr:NUDIX hydrolase [Streptococcus suis]AER22393.1 MutT/NudX family protein (putative) [Streptococcus suis ST1]MDW8593652.1 NUDIX hydrolase [Streptococcus suis]MDW8623117.1 NUDIX hydrolase [Streptococcus suis]NQK00734.1 NUDIX hydrolase [Streptococcus suis]NQK04794.1 NUDIX hydrolase [Streptococcus suis]